MSHIDEGLLHAWIDGALRDEKRSARDAIERHLAGCGDCRARLEDARLLRDEVATILAATTPPGLEEAPPFEELIARAGGLETTTARQRSRRPHFPLTWAATLILALGAGWWAHHLTTPTSPGAHPHDAGEWTVATPESPAGRASTQEMGPATTPEIPAIASSQDAAPTRSVSGAEAEAIPHPAERKSGAGSAVASGRPVAPEVQAGEIVPVITTTRRHSLALAPIEPPPPADGWERVDHAAAEAWTGAPLALAPGLPILELAIAQVEGAHAVRVRQELPDGNLIELVQRVGLDYSEASGREGPGIGRKIIGVLTWLPGLLAGDDEHPSAGKEPGRNTDGRWSEPGRAVGTPMGRSGVRPGQPGDPPLVSARSHSYQPVPGSAAEQIALLPQRAIPPIPATKAPAAHRHTPDPLAGSDSVEFLHEGSVITIRALVPSDSLQMLPGRIR